MKRRAVVKVLIDPAGQLFVQPQLDPGATYESIYREANGLRWDSQHRALHAYEPKRWEPVELLQHIAATLYSAYDERLQVSEDTVWEGVPQELQATLRATLAKES